MEKTTDKKLLDLYDKVYKAGEEKFWTFLPIEERLAVLGAIDFTGKRVLEIGCGTGDFAAWMATAGAACVVGNDASLEAIKAAKKKYKIDNLFFSQSDLSEKRCSEVWDVVIMIGVLEHVNSPESFLKKASKALKSGGDMFVTCPHFNNVRGALWMAFKILFDAPMSLTDKHEITPIRMKQIIDDDPAITRLKLHDSWTVDRSWADDERFIQDFRKRLPKVFPDINKEKIKECMDFFQQNISLFGDGANIIYHLEKA